VCTREPAASEFQRDAHWTEDAAVRPVVAIGVERSDVAVVIAKHQEGCVTATARIDTARDATLPDHRVAVTTNAWVRSKRHADCAVAYLRDALRERLRGSDVRGEDQQDRYWKCPGRALRRSLVNTHDKFLQDFGLRWKSDTPGRLTVAF
jgi:hypothetical protein